MNVSLTPELEKFVDGKVRERPVQQRRRGDPGGTSVAEGARRDPAQVARADRARLAAGTARRTGKVLDHIDQRINARRTRGR
jgi:hypothetical protein